MSFIYPRTISVLRTPVNDDVSNHDYSARVPPLTVIASNIPASIQLRAQTTKPNTNLPQDVSNDTYWRIFIPKKALAKGIIKKSDVIEDEEGNRYEVDGDYWNSLGYNILAKNLNA